MATTSPKDVHAVEGNAQVAEGHRIEDAADEIFERAQDSVRSVADQASHLALEGLERGRAGVREFERTTHRGREVSGRRATGSPLATALAVGAMGYAIATLIHRAAGKGDRKG